MEVSDVDECGDGEQQALPVLSAVQPQRFYLEVAYDGAFFHGCQSQGSSGGLLTVHALMSAALRRSGLSSAEEPLVVFAGRTDAGVHAASMPVHIDVDKVSKVTGAIIADSSVVARALQAALNDVTNRGLRIEGASELRGRVAGCDAEALPRPRNARPVNPIGAPLVRLLSVRAVPRSFHARSSADRRRYFYYLHVVVVADRSLLEPRPDSSWWSSNDGLPTASLFADRRVWSLVAPRWDGELFAAALRSFVGRHDFRHFSAEPASAIPAATTRFVERCGAIDLGDAMASDPLHSQSARNPSASSSPLLVRVDIVGHSFAYHQVRMMVGAAAATAQGLMSVDDVKTALTLPESSAPPSAFQMAPAHGLFFAGATYPDAAFDEELSQGRVFRAHTSL